MKSTLILLTALILSNASAFSLKFVNASSDETILVEAGERGNLSKSMNPGKVRGYSRTNDYFSQVDFYNIQNSGIQVKVWTYSESPLQSLKNEKKSKTIECAPASFFANKSAEEVKNMTVTYAAYGVCSVN